MPSPARRARNLAEQLLEVLEDTIEDLSLMPFFVRPMVRRGYKKRTGRSLEEWLASARRLIERLGDDAVTLAGVTAGDAGLTGDLAALEENYRTAPRRAARGMRSTTPATLRVLEQRMERRQTTVAELLEALHALPEG